MYHYNFFVRLVGLQSVLFGAILYFVSFFVSRAVHCIEEEKKLLKKPPSYLSVPISRVLVNCIVRSNLLNVRVDRLFHVSCRMYFHL